MKKVFICSRYKGNVETNVKIAKILCQEAVKRGYAPFAPHLFYTQFLNDNIAEERNCGIKCRHLFLEWCDIFWIYTGNGISEGMQADLGQAKKFGKEIIEINKLSDFIPRKKYKCNLCGRDKFEKPEPHICGGQYVKNLKKRAKKLGIEGNIWQEITNKGEK